MTLLFILPMLILLFIIIAVMAYIVAMIEVHREQKRILQDGEDEDELTGDQMLEQ